MLLLTLVLATTFAGGQSRPEILHAVGGLAFRTYDPSSGELLSSTPVHGIFNPQGLSYSSGRLLTIDTNIGLLRDQLVEIHPATTHFKGVGLTGLSLPWAGNLLRDPLSGRLVAEFGGTFYEVDESTGAFTYLSSIEQNKAVLTSLAVDSRGNIYGYNYPNMWHPVPALFLVDPDTGFLIHVGDLPTHPFFFVQAAAFDASDTLWVAGNGPSIFFHRLYKIDVESLEVSSAFPIEFGITSMTFGPAPDVQSYCTPKTNSAACEPVIGWSGIPSATAHFGFEVTCSDAVNQSPGFLMLGLGGAADLPFQGGTLCVAEPILRTTPQSSGGSAPGTLDCSGSWSLDVNTWLFSQHPLAPGDAFACQWWGRDRGLAGPFASQLSDALEVVLFP